jgi:hypothetical protein
MADNERVKRTKTTCFEKCHDGRGVGLRGAKEGGILSSARGGVSTSDNNQHIICMTHGQQEGCALRAREALSPAEPTVSIVTGQYENDHAMP